MRRDRIVAQNRVALLREVANAERVSAPKITIGISTSSHTFGLWSKIPMPSSNAVTTAQIVRMM